MATSKKQILANRRNAKKSTGPKTREGKLRTSKNAIQHGLDAEKFVVIGEKINDLVIFRDRLIDHLKPQGIQEEIVVSKMIDVAIRLRRIPIIESGIFNHEMLEYEAKENKGRVAHSIEGIGDKEIIISANTIICKTGLAKYLSKDFPFTEIEPDPRFNQTLAIEFFLFPVA